jgi:hypothetical protein
MKNLDAFPKESLNCQPEDLLLPKTDFKPLISKLSLSE